jgi:hypothetical protein
MNCGPVVQCNNAKNPALEFGHETPEANPSITLVLAPDRTLNYGYTPLDAQVRALAQDLFTEVAGGFVQGCSLLPPAPGGSETRPYEYPTLQVHTLQPRRHPRQPSPKR